MNVVRFTCFNDLPVEVENKDGEERDSDMRVLDYTAIHHQPFILVIFISFAVFSRLVNVRKVKTNLQ